MIFQKVQETIASHNLIKSDEHIVLGLSGGPDSVCLFHILLRLRQTLGIRLHPVHVNHGLRPGAAERDQNYVEELCREHGVSCKVITADCRELARAWHMTSEEAGRSCATMRFMMKHGRSLKNWRRSTAKARTLSRSISGSLWLTMRTIRRKPSCFVCCAVRGQTGWRGSHMSERSGDSP